MSLSAFCSVCDRIVYLEEGQALACPVCSTPLLEDSSTNSDVDEAATP